MMLPLEIDTDATQGKKIQVAQEYADIHAFMKVRSNLCRISFELYHKALERIIHNLFCQFPFILDSCHQRQTVFLG